MSDNINDKKSHSKNFISSKNFSKIALIIFVILILFLTFSAGVFVGWEKARFSYRWGDNYYHNFVGRPEMFSDDRYLNARGVFGEIIKIDNSTSSSSIIINGQDNVERTILVTANTVIRRFDQDLKLADLKVGDKLVIIGSPNDQGQIEARLIRIAPDFFPPDSPNTPFLRH